MLAVLWSLISGTLFGVGLSVSGMINPAKVIGFLDITGNWDPTLAFVMAGALAAAAPGFAIARRRPAPFVGRAFHIPPAAGINVRLLIGATIFGVGWGIAGFCPGPAIAALSTGMMPVFIFVAAMIAGMLLNGLMPVASAGR
jgi:uncharacterized protein